MATKNKKASLRTSVTFSPYLAIASTLPAIIAILVLGIVPSLLTIGLSFTDYDGDLTRIKFVWLQNYANFFTVLRLDVFSYIWNTVKYGAYTILPVQIISLGTALLVVKSFGKNFFRALFFMPSILGGAVISLIWKLMFDPIGGPFAQLLAVFGKSSAFFGDPNISLFLIAVVAVWSGYGFSMAIYLAGIQGISSSYYEAASIDGASPWRSFWSITLPLIRPAMGICLWMSIGGALGMSDMIMLITKGMYNTKTFAYYLLEITLNNSMNAGQIAALNMYSFFINSSIMLSFNHFFRKKEVEL